MREGERERGREGERERGREKERDRKRERKKRREREREIVVHTSFYIRVCYTIRKLLCSLLHNNNQFI